MHQSHGYAFPLVMQLRSSISIQNILETGGDKPCRLLYKASPTRSSCQCQGQIFDKSKRVIRSPPYYQKPDTCTMKDRPKTQTTNSQSYKGVLVKLATKSSLANFSDGKIQILHAEGFFEETTI